MERLTKRENGHAHYPRCFEEPCGGMGCRTEDCEFKDEICERLAADVAPVVHGRWEPTKTPFMNECEDCSVCGYRTIWGHGFNYCPNCGARMDGKDGGEIG